MKVHYLHLFIMSTVRMDVLMERQGLCKDSKTAFRRGTRD